MSIRIAAIIFTLGMPLCALAQENVATREQAKNQPDEVLIIGERVRRLRTQMMETEIQTYDLFNKFNDDKRFNIDCSIRSPTGTRFKRVVCSTGFEREATEEHARDYVDNLTFGTTPGAIPQESKIAAQLPEFKQKMKQVAEQHPEFLRAVIRYAKVQKDFEEATRTWKEQN